VLVDTKKKKIKSSYFWAS